MTERIFIRKELAEQMMELARRMRQKPECGILFGRKDSSGKIIVDYMVQIPNIAREWHQHININKMERKNIIEEESAKGYQHVGDFHTHKKICKVTTIDKYAIENIYGDALWIISTPNQIRAYKIEPKQEDQHDYTEIPIFIIRRRQVNQQETSTASHSSSATPPTRSNISAGEQAT